MLRVGAGEVDLELVAGDGDGGADRQLAVGASRARPRLEAAVGKPRRSRRGRPAPSRRTARPSPRGRRRRRAARRARRRARRRGLGGELGAEVAARARRGSASARRAASRVSGVEPRRRDHDALLLERARVGRHAARLGAADVGVVGARDGEAERGARDERDVGEVRAAGERVVEDEDVVAARVVAADRGDRVGHRAEVDGDVLGLRDHAAALVEERGRAVAPLLDVGGERRPDQRRAHLLGDGAERGPENLELNVHALLPRHLREPPDATIPNPHPPRGDPAGGAVQLDHRRAGHGLAGAGRRGRARARRAPRRCGRRRARAAASRSA